MGITVETLLSRVSSLELVSGRSAIDLEGLEFDSRRVESGDLFVALVGENVDGHAYITEALDHGAAAIMVQDVEKVPGFADCPVLVTPDTRRLLADIARVFYGAPADELRCIGITGTDGKTTVARMLRRVYEQERTGVGEIGTFGIGWNESHYKHPNTTPESAVLQRTFRDMLDDGVDTCVMEVSSHGIALGRIRGIDFNGALFSNLGRDHLNFHGTMEAYRETIFGFFRNHLPAPDKPASEQPVAVINRGDKTGRKLLRQLENRVGVQSMTYGLDVPEADFTGRIVDADPSGIRFDLEGPDRTTRLQLPVVGAFNVENAVGAAAVAVATGVSWEAAVSGLQNLDPVPGRLQKVPAGSEKAPNLPNVFVDYAHTPGALEHVLSALDGLSSGRLFVVFGCGGDRDAGKRKKMGRAAARGADIAVLTNDNPRSEDPEQIAGHIETGLTDRMVRQDSSPPRSGQYCVQLDRELAITRTIASAAPEDTVLIAGKGHEATQTFRDETVEFKDAEVAKAALEQRLERK